MFCSARWKAYLRTLQSFGKDDAVREDASDQEIDVIHYFHSQMIWFVRDDDNNNHNEIAGKHLKRCDALLEESSTMLDALEDTLAKTPKPSEVLEWF